MSVIKLKTQASAVAIFNIVTCAISLILLCLPQFWTYMEIDSQPIFYFEFVLVTLGLAAAIILLIGVIKENILMCTIWWIFNFIVLVLWIFSVLVIYFFERDVLGFVARLISVAFYTFQINIVMDFMKKVQVRRLYGDGNLEQTVVYSRDPQT